MASVVIPYAPDIDIHIVSAVLSKDGTPELVVYHPNIREYVLPEYVGELTYEMIKDDILHGHAPFYARAYIENERNVLRIIIPIDNFYKVIKENTLLTGVVSITKSTSGFPVWVSSIEWYDESSKQQPLEVVDAIEKRSRNSQTPQKGSKQQRSISVDPPSREGDTVFWH